jgi:hypothetical protein
VALVSLSADRVSGTPQSRSGKKSPAHLTCFEQMSLVLVLGTVQKSCGPRYVSTQLWLQESFDSQEWQFSGRQRRSWKHRAVVKVIRGHILLLLWNDCAITISDMYVCIYIYNDNHNNSNNSMQESYEVIMLWSWWQVTEKSETSSRQLEAERP